MTEHALSWLFCSSASVIPLYFAGFIIPGINAGIGRDG